MGVTLTFSKIDDSNWCHKRKLLIFLRGAVVPTKSAHTKRRPMTISAKRDMLPCRDRRQRGNRDRGHSAKIMSLLSCTILGGASGKLTIYSKLHLDGELINADLVARRRRRSRRRDDRAPDAAQRAALAA
jgi:hypothetical protein